MKTIIIALAFVFATSIGELSLAQAENKPVLIAQNYCPEGKICVATNMTATATAKSKFAGTQITGISIYKVGNSYVAEVPSHGSLYLYQKDGEWYFDANGVSYEIDNWSPQQ